MTRNMSFSRWLDNVAPDKRDKARQAADEWMVNSSDWREFERAVCDAIGPDMWTAWKAYCRLVS